ncbi:uncharacterized protein Gasu_11370 [Galdieria sulphuraria]|uniref:Uncharacterized protein n=1 Tax=Galdieria sulphuraria TaxID=130081 RepID=M2XNJ8_GALSU|nr:uncharacterized protein Gasu_11370 [Galdieria sulphuraria]EME31762.1 hypothetical protein Gasu_11370 [Galdieria sulphuraria]|eukprot:XP_005708282.1 hypothetical protein Gasu_11370 [Galdieria sulphuraria]
MLPFNLCWSENLKNLKLPSSAKHANDKLLGIKKKRRLSIYSKTFQFNSGVLLCLGFVALLLLWFFGSLQSYPILWFQFRFRGYEKVDPFIFQNCSKVDFGRRFAVVIPFIPKQTNRVLSNLKRWASLEYFPCDTLVDSLVIESTDLFFYYDMPLDHPSVQESIHTLTRWLRKEPLQSVVSSCFHNVRFISANLSAEQSTNSYKMDFVKSSVKTEGTVRQFRAVVNHPSLINTHRHFFYMEPDHIPIRNRWLSAIFNDSLQGDFWMKGSLMRYKPRFSCAFEPYRTQYLRHINGNAIYKVGDPCFMRFLENVYREYPDFAFDTSINFYRLDLRHYITYQYTAHRFQVTEVMADLGVVRYDEDRLRSDLPNTYTAHGKFMYTEKQLGWQKY